MNEKGLSLLEILIAVMILAVIMTGLANIFVVSKRHILHSRSRIQSAELGRLFLEPLHMDVTMSERSPSAQNGWGQLNNCLTGGAGCLGAQTLDNITYTPAYQTTPLLPDVANPLGRLRKVEITITWNEPSP